MYRQSRSSNTCRYSKLRWAIICTAKQGNKHMYIKSTSANTCLYSLATKRFLINKLIKDDIFYLFKRYLAVVYLIRIVSVYCFCIVSMMFTTTASRRSSFLTLLLPTLCSCLLVGAEQWGYPAPPQHLRTPAQETVRRVQPAVRRYKHAASHHVISLCTLYTVHTQWCRPY